MLLALLIGSLVTLFNLGILVMVMMFILRHLVGRLAVDPNRTPGNGADIYTLCFVLACLFVGHLVQFASWAVVFMWLGEFSDFTTAFYHSSVNFASLGYGDIVMSERWRLLGALEATNGVLMLGLSAGMVLTVMNKLFQRHKVAHELRDRLSP